MVGTIKGRFQEAPNGMYPAKFGAKICKTAGFVEHLAEDSCLLVTDLPLAVGAELKVQINIEADNLVEAKSEITDRFIPKRAIGTDVPYRCHLKFVRVSDLNRKDLRDHLEKIRSGEIKPPIEAAEVPQEDAATRKSRLRAAASGSTPILRLDPKFKHIPIVKEVDPRRKHFRLTMKTGIDVTFNNRTYHGFTLNISAGGIRFRGRDMIPVASRCDVRIPLKGKIFSNLVGEVKWLRHVPDMKTNAVYYETGMRIVERGQEFLKLLHYLINRERQEDDIKLANNDFLYEFKRSEEMRSEFENNIKMGGMFLPISPVPDMKRGDSINLGIILPEDLEEIWVQAKVVHVVTDNMARQSDAEAGLALAIDNLSDEVVKTMDQYLVSANL